MSSPTPPASPRFLTLTQAAEELNVTMSQIYALVRSGDLVGIQIGGRNQWRVERSKLEEYIDRAYQRTAENLKDLPAALPGDTA
ncbi:helix-turn-helix domain-containing protein [Nakamurella flava]|uniref:Helix-turn-helix domain-containing protein n=1 Tax=Nakamurella flava TaxID=2576308 RepID=A0A4U6QMR5_9ACTN|nr:helix-turn-helix domain-containing protein [Nakamurella flava]TKV61322.1 helix-turn-helix domain-containing protein [Nakamurella flava]